MRNLKNKNAITLIALVITIVVLIILAAVAINLSLGNNGIFNRAKTAKEKYANAQEYEQTEIVKSSNRIDEYAFSNRGGTSVYKSLINKADGVYNSSENGYIFTLGTYNQITSNNTIVLNESVENYDCIVFLTDFYYKGRSGYWSPSRSEYDVDQIRNNYNNNNYFVLNVSVSDNNGRVIGTFVNNTTFTVNYAWASDVNNFTKLRITDIKGLKY